MKVIPSADTVNIERFSDNIKIAVFFAAHIAVYLIKRDKEGNEITVVVGAQKTTTVDFADDYVATGGPLTITKTFDGDADKLSQEQKDGVAFHVTGPDGYDTTFTYADMTEGSKTLEDLMPGEYRVEESNQFFDGYTCATTYQVGSENSQKVDLTADGAAISVTNTYTKNTTIKSTNV